MKYLSVAEARKQPGLRLVLSAHVPGPWGEAAKAVLSARHVAYIPVAQTVFEPNEELQAWTGVRNAPVAVLDDEPALTTWLEILMLAERLGTGPSLLPDDPLDRALVLGLSAELCGPDGFGWSRRLHMLRPNNSTIQPPRAASDYRPTVLRNYGVRPEAIARAPERLVSILTGLATQLRRQQGAGSDYLVGDRLSACDLYWACLSQMVAPLAQADCPMPDYMRANYANITPDITAALDPALIRHRDAIFQRHIGLPLDF